MAILSIEEESNFMTIKAGNPGKKRIEMRGWEFWVKERTRNDGIGNLKLLLWPCPDYVPMKLPISKELDLTLESNEENQLVHSN